MTFNLMWAAETSGCPAQALTLADLEPSNTIQPSGTSAGLPAPGFLSANKIMKVPVPASLREHMYRMCFW
jgi:hypothetical protein